MSGAPRRYPGESRRSYVEECQACGKRSYRTRREARRAARTVPGAVHMNSYLCPVAPEELPAYHIGHLPQRVRNGEVPKGRYLRGADKVIVSLPEVGVGIQATYDDPRDMARIVDALLVAAQLADLDGKHTLKARYLRIANQTGDALTHSDAPPINPVPDMPRQELLA